MDKKINDFITDNNAQYIKMLIDKANLDLEPYILETGEKRKGYFFDKEKNVLAYINKEARTVHCCIANSDLVTKKGEYRVGIFEYLGDKGINIYFSFYGLGYNIQIGIDKNKVEFSYCYDDKPRHPYIDYDSDNNIIFKPVNSEPIKYQDVTIDQLMSMVEAMYQDAINVNNSFDDKELEKQIFEFAKPVLRDAISKNFTITWKERLANWKNEPTGSTMEKVAGSIIDNENVKYVGCDCYNKIINYENDEINMQIYGLNTDYSSVSIDFKDEGKNKVNTVHFIRNTKSINPYVHIVFNNEKGSKNINFVGPEVIDIYTLDGQNVTCSRRTKHDKSYLYWYEMDPERRGIINLNEYGIQNFVDKIKWVMSCGVNNPKFERLFDIIRPVLVQCTLEISLNEIKRQSAYIGRNNDEIEEINSKLNSANEFEKRELNKQKEVRCKAKEKANERITEIEESILDEFGPNNTMTK